MNENKHCVSANILTDHQSPAEDLSLWITPRWQLHPPWKLGRDCLLHLCDTGSTFFTFLQVHGLCKCVDRSHF